MKKVPELRFPGFEVEWIKKELLDVSEIVMGQSPKSENYNNKGKGLPLIQGNADIKNKYTEPQMYTTESTKICNNGDIILTVRAPVGEVAKSKHKACIGRGVCAIQPNINNEYLYYFLLKNEKNWRKYSQGSTFEAVNSNDIKKFPVILSKSKQEQQKIADFFSTLDSRIEIQEEKVKNLEDQKKGYMQKIFSQEIRFKDENGEDYPEWEENVLGSLCSIATGKLDANAMVNNGEYRFYTCAKEFFAIDNYSFDTEALLVSGNGANVGYIHYYKGKFNAYQRTYVLDGFENNIIYIKYYMDRYLPRRIYSEKKDGNTPYIVMSTLSDMEIKLPCLEEQQKIANFLSLFDEKIETEKMILETLQEMKKGFLQKMFM